MTARATRALTLTWAVALLAWAAAALEASTAKPTYRLRLVAQGLGPITQVVAVPGSRTGLYVVQRAGRVRELVRGALSRTALLDVRNRTSGEGERGLLSIAFHPEYAGNGRLYAFFTGRDGAVNIVEYQVRGGRANDQSARTLLLVPHADSPYHNGGQLAFGPDGRLYAGFGDGGYIGLGGTGRPQEDPHGNSQNLGVLLAKIVSLNADAADPVARVVAYGLRNPWRFSFAPGSGDLIIGDVGFNSFEEIDVLRRTAAEPVNFGWSVYEGRQRRTDAQVALNPTGELVFPALTYRTSSRRDCAITGGYVYRGSVARLQGRYVFGDYCSGRIWSVVLRDGRASGLRLEPVRARNLVSFGEDGRGELYAVTLSGRLYRFARR